MNQAEKMSRVVARNDERQRIGSPFRADKIGHFGVFSGRASYFQCSLNVYL